MPRKRKQKPRARKKSFTPNEKALAFFELARIKNCIMAAVAILIGFFIASGADYFSAGIAALSGFLVCAGGQAINDYFDRKIDAISSKNRPIPSGKVSARQALWFSLALFIIGIGFAGQINVTAQFIAILMTILLIAYPLFMNKVKYVGNVIVALGTAITFVYGAAAAGNVLPLIIALSASAFFSNMAREVTKDIEDVKKDSKAKKTLPLILGLKKSKAFPVVYYALAILVSIWVFFYFKVNPGYFFVALIGAVFFIYSAQILLNNNAKKSQGISKLGMLISLSAYILAGLK